MDFDAGSFCYDSVTNRARRSPCGPPFGAGG
jgi:hypothetical protein